MSDPTDIVAISSAVDDPASLDAARALLAGDTDAALDSLFKRLLREHTLTDAIHHLERAGGDLERLTVSSARFHEFPLSLLMAPPPEVRPGRVSLETVRQRLAAHRALLRRTVADLADLCPAELTLLSGLSMAATYRALATRHHNDADLFFPDRDACRPALNALLEKLRFSLARVRTGKVDGHLVESFALIRQSPEGNFLMVELFVGGRATEPHGKPPWSLPSLFERSRVVSWEARRFRAPAPEEMLFLIAEKTRRQRHFARRDFNDARFLLTEERGRIDWPHLVEITKQHHLAAALGVLGTEAERLAGRPLVPPDVRGSLEPGRLEKELLARRPKLWGEYWTVQHLGARLRHPRSVTDFARGWLEANVQAMEQDLVVRAFRRRLREIDPEIDRFWWGHADFVHPL